MPIKRIRAVFCDGGNILFKDSEIKSRQYGKVSKFLPGLSFEQFSRQFLKYKKKAQTTPGYSIHDALKDYLVETGNPKLAEKISPKDKKETRLRLRPGIKGVLIKLRQMGILFIILTDAAVEGKFLVRHLEEMGISKYVSDIISSKDVGFNKPDKRFFSYALKKHKLKKQDVVFIGHDLDELKGAFNLGFKVYAVFHDKCDLSFLPEENILCSFKDILSALNFPNT